MRKRFLPLAVAALAIASALAALAGCSQGNHGDESNGEHEHIINNDAPFAYDDEGHWAQSTCHPDVIIDKQSHNFVNGKFFQDEDENGVPIIVQKCNDCEYMRVHDCASYEEKVYMADSNGHYSFPACIEQHSSLNEIRSVTMFFMNFIPDIQPHTYNDMICTACGNDKWGEIFVFSLSSDDDGQYISISGIRDNSLTEITVPETIMGLPVKEWCVSDFRDMCPDVESVTFPATLDFSVLYDNFSCFPYCVKLKKIEMPGVTKIPRGMFAGCIALEEVVLSDKLTFIGERAFQSCGITEITLPAGVTEIGEGAFEFCRKLTDIHLNEGLQTIGASAFNLCDSLTQLTLPASVTEIGLDSNLLFGGEEWKVAEGNTEYVAQDGILYNADKTTIVSVPQRLSGEVTVPGSVSTIPMSAFDERLITSVTIGEGVAEIGIRAFASCPSLQSISLPESVTKIGGGAFCENSSLVSLTYEGTIDAWYEIERGTDLAFGVWSCTLTCTDGTIDEIDETVYDYLSFTKLTDGTYEVKGVSNGMPSSLVIPAVYRGREVTRIADSAFNGFRSIQSVYTGDNVVEIGVAAFKGCTNIASISIGEKTEKICFNAFNGCKAGGGSNNLHVTFAADSVLHTVEAGAFDETTLTSIALPDSVANFGGFSTIGQLREVTFSKNIGKLTQYMLYGCRNVETINFHGTMDEWTALAKETGWNHADHAGTIILTPDVVCSDGTVKITL